MLKKIMTTISVLVLWGGFFVSPVTVLAGGGGGQIDKSSSRLEEDVLVGDEGTQLIISDLTLKTATSGGLVETNLLAAMEETTGVDQRSSWLGVGLEIILVGSAVWLFWKKKINFMSTVLVAVAASWIVAFIFWLTLDSFWIPIAIIWVLNSASVVLALWHNLKK